MDRQSNYLQIALGCLLLVVTCLASADSSAQNTGADSDRSSATGQPNFGVSHIVLVTATGRHSFDVEVAATSAQRHRGLMYRSQIGSTSGMLFDFDTPRMVAMWMKNTLISLDMIFINARGGIIRIVENTKPNSFAIIRSGGKALAVLEVAAGTAAHLGLKSGDRVEHDMFRRFGD